MSVRMSFHVFVESKDLELIRRVVSAFEFDPDDSGITVAVSPELPGCWLTLTDGTKGVNFWGLLETAVPEGMVRWWEVSNSEFDDSAFVHAFASDGKQRWSSKLDKGVARMRKELGATEIDGAFLPDDWGELEGAAGTGLSSDWEDELAVLLGGSRKKKARKPEKDPHEAWHARDDKAMLKKPQALVAAAPDDLSGLRDRLDYAEALWRCARTADARRVLAKLRPTGEHEVRETLETAAPAIWTNARARYLPDFSLALLDALPAKAQKGRYWLHRAQALARLKRPELIPLLRRLFAKGALVGDIELNEALEAMPRGSQRKDALKLFVEAVARAERSGSSGF